MLGHLYFLECLLVEALSYSLLVEPQQLLLDNLAILGQLPLRNALGLVHSLPNISIEPQQPIPRVPVHQIIVIGDVLAVWG